MKMRECIHCQVMFDLRSSAKKQAGGRINECADCVEELGTETAVKYLGLQAGDGSPVLGRQLLAFTKGSPVISQVLRPQLATVLCGMSIMWVQTAITKEKHKKLIS